MKKILLFAALLCTMISFTQAQDTESTISPNYVKYWIGTGSNQVVFIVNWCDPDTALAWGYRFSEDSLLVSDVLNAIVTADARLTTAGTSSWLTDIMYIDGTDTFKIDPDYIVYNRNGQYADVITAEYVFPDDYLKFGGYECATMDNVTWASTWNTPIEPVEIPGVPVADATISTSNINYWVGTGSNEAIFIVNWCNPDTALAWGYRFDGESALVSTMLTDIANADPRFSFEGSTSWLTDLVFTMGGDSLKISPDYVTYNVNGSYANAADQQYIHAGDYVKFGGYGCAQLGESTWIEDDWGPYWMYASVWTAPITAVSIPTSVEAYENENLSVYPNPCTDIIRIQTSGNEFITLYDVRGTVIMQTQATDTVTELNVNELPSGIYFVKCDNKTAKIVKR